MKKEKLEARRRERDRIFYELMKGLEKDIKEIKDKEKQNENKH